MLQRMFNEQNASVQDREMVITNVLDNEPVQHSEMVITNVLDNYEPVTDAVPLTFAYPEGSGGRGPRGHGAGDRSRGSRGEYQGSTSSENSHSHSTFAGIYMVFVFLFFSVVFVMIIHDYHNVQTITLLHMHGFWFIL